MYKALLGALALVFSCVGAVQAADLLFYGPSIGNDKGIPSNEVEVAMDDGHNVTVVDNAEWAGMTQGQFASYDAIVFGDGGCDSEDTDFSVPNANKTTWSPIVTGPIVVHTFDPFAHQGDNPGAIILTSNGMDVASSGPGTGLYYANGCRDTLFPAVPAKGDGPDFFSLPFLSEFGTFVLQNRLPGDGSVNPNDITVVDSSNPVVDGLNDSNLSNWGSSAHALIDTWPPEFSVVATGEDCINPEDKAENGGPVIGKGECPDDKGVFFVSGVVLIVRGARHFGPIPALSPLGLGLLGLVLAGLGGFVVRRRRR